MILNTILVATDFAEPSARAVAIAGLIAERWDVRTLKLLHAEAAEAPVYFTNEQIAALERQRETQRKQAARYLTDFGRQHTGRTFTAAIHDGPPVEAILQESAGADLVVMGTHGLAGPKRWWLGSVAEHVLRAIDRPLLIVRADAERSPETVFTRIVVHAAVPLHGEGAMQFASRLASSFGGMVTEARRDTIETALSMPEATLLVSAMPMPQSGRWVSHYGDVLIRSSNLPILFVPEAEASRLGSSEER